ncbi:MAG: LEA type 2 family protein [Bacteroidetes bacterium]|nr:LEA type 2 family protein [Bacteroidota bacterium]
MRKIVVKILISSLFLAGVLYTCGGIKVPEVTGIELTGMDSFADGKFYGQGIVTIKNNNSIQIASKNVEFDLFYRNKQVSSGETQENFVLKGKQATRVPVRFAIMVDSLLEYANEILGKDTVEFNSKVTGNFTALSFKISHKQVIKLPTKTLISGLVGQLAQEGVKISNPGVEKFTLQKTTLTFDLNVKNTLPFDLVITECHFDVLNKEDATNSSGEWELTDVVTIPPDTDTLINSKAVVNNFQAATDILGNVMKRKLDFYIDGYAMIDYKGSSIKIPLKQHLVFNPLTGEIRVQED